MLSDLSFKDKMKIKSKYSLHQKLKLYVQGKCYFCCSSFSFQKTELKSYHFPCSQKKSKFHLISWMHIGLTLMIWKYDESGNQILNERVIHKKVISGLHRNFWITLCKMYVLFLDKDFWNCVVISFWWTCEVVKQTNCLQLEQFLLSI